MTENEPAEEISDELTAKLIHFHDITQIDDLDQCKSILQQHNWNVEQAVQVTFGDINEPATSPRVSTPVPTSSSSHTIANQADGGPRRRVISPPHSLIHHHNVVPRQMIYVGGRPRPPPRGIFGWGYYLLFMPIQYTFSQVLNIFKFIYRIFFPDPRERITDPIGDVTSFVDEFQEQYPEHPQFFRGSYGKAQEEAKKQIQFLLIYLHDPNHEDTDAFCHDTLCNPTTIEFINRKVILWACSISKPEGYKVSKIIRNPTYPLLALTCLYQNQMAIIGRIQGKITSDELITRLSEMINIYEPSLISARADKDARNQNLLIRKEQDEAYLISLQKDKEKMDIKKREKEVERQLKEKKEQIQRDKELKKDLCLQRRARCKEELVPEPDGSETNVYDLIIKLPNGSRLRRKFKATDTVKTLHDFIYAQDDSPSSFQVYSNFPRRSLPGCCTVTVYGLGLHHQSLQDVGLNKNDTLFVQAVHSDDDDSDEEDEASR